MMWCIVILQCRGCSDLWQNNINLSYHVMKDGTMRIKDAGISQVIPTEFCPVAAGKPCWELDW